MNPILLATDGSPSAAAAADEAIMLAKALGAPLVAVSVEHVNVPAYGYYGYSEVLAELTKAEQHRIGEVLEAAKKRAAEQGLECETVSVTGPIVDAICETARKRKASLIVIGAHGFGPVRRLVVGSVSTGVLHEAPCPVLVARGEYAEDKVEAAA